MKKSVVQLEAERHEMRLGLTDLPHRSDLSERATTMMQHEGGARVICFLPRGRHIMGFGRGALLWLLGVPLTMYRLRSTEQMDLVTAAQLPDLWRAE